MTADTKTCEHCGKVFVRIATGNSRTSKSNFEKRRFCSNACTGLSRGGGTTRRRRRSPSPPMSPVGGPIGTADMASRREAAAYASRQLLVRLNALLQSRENQAAQA